MTIKALDCTLRDGGYINNWLFDTKHCISILRSLCDAGLEIIECGYVNSAKGCSEGSTQFDSLITLNNLLSGNFHHMDLDGHLFVAMINYQDLVLDQIPVVDGHSIQGIRLAFHKADRHEVPRVANVLIERGYKVFIQPMVTSGYTEQELIEMIAFFSELDIYAFYLVDSFGSLTPRVVSQYADLFVKHLPNCVGIGFHGHNNQQLAFANAITFMESFNSVDRDIIVDVSMFGMGRGAGNLNTELFLNYANKHCGGQYLITPILETIDSYLASVHEQSYWGYSIAQYLSSIYDCHPNYANYLIKKRRLSMCAIKDVIESIVSKGITLYDEQVVENAYQSYLASNQQSNAIIQIDLLAKAKGLLVLGPGISSVKYAELINSIAHDKRLFVVSVNHIPGPNGVMVDACFVSNQKRMSHIESLSPSCQIWISSDVHAEGSSYVIDFPRLIQSIPGRHDDASILLMALALMNGVKSIYLAGLDGYSDHAHKRTYSFETFDYAMTEDFLKKANRRMAASLQWVREQADLTFLTPSHYQHEMPLKVLGVIPARFKSSRFPGKPLAKIAGQELIMRTYHCVKDCDGLDHVVVATDSDDIYQFCIVHQIPVVMTSPDHQTGTDRVAEAFNQFGSYDFCINVQGDEPIIRHDAIHGILEAYRKDQGKYDVYNLYRIVSAHEAMPQKIVKVVTNDQDELLYMSRQVLPYDHQANRVAQTIKKQVCVYGFTPQALRAFSSYRGKSYNEGYEDIEILRFVDSGFSVKLIEYKHDTLSVDYPDDIQKVESYLEVSSDLENEMAS